jgi:hypothetical protein
MASLGSAALASPPQSLEIRLAAQPSPGRWVKVTSLSGDAREQVVPVQDGARTVSLTGVPPGPAMICAGGEGLATSCERVILAQGEAVAVAGPAAGVRVTGRLLVGRTPAAGARLAVVPHPLAIRRFFAVPLARRGETVFEQVATDDKGRFTFPLLAPGDYRLDIRPAGGRLDQGEPFTVPDPRKLRKKESDPVPPVLDLGDLGLAEGIRLEVTVTDAAGQPIRGAGVGAMQGASPAEAKLFEIYSDAAGLAVLSGLEAAQPVSVTCLAQGYVRKEQKFDAVPGAVRCALDRYSAIEGKIVDEEDKAVAGATVTLRPHEVEQRVLSEKDGRFFLGMLQAGSYELTVAAKGFRVVKRSVRVAPQEQAKLDPVRLSPAEALEGKVVDGLSREPVAGATVSVTDPPGAGSAVSGEEGVFSLPAASEEALLLEVRAEGYPPASVKVAPESQASGEPLEVELLPGGRVHVSLWNEESDTPCAGCSVSLMGGGRSHSLVTDTRGEALSELLAPDRYQVSPVRMRSLGGVVQVSGGDDTRQVTVEPHRTARVQFGEKRQAVEVVFVPSPPSGWMLQTEAGPRFEMLSPRPDGSFAVRKAAGEAVQLSLRTAAGVQVRQAVLPADFDAPVLRLDLPETSVQGTLLRDEQPVAGAVQIVSAADGAVAATARSDEAGAFFIPHLPAGLYSVLAGNQPVRSFELPDGGAVDLGRITMP